jgi:hypothetical protein
VVAAAVAMVVAAAVAVAATDPRARKAIQAPADRWA